MGPKTLSLLNSTFTVSTPTFATLPANTFPSIFSAIYVGKPHFCGSLVLTNVDPRNDPQTFCKSKFRFHTRLPPPPHPPPHPPPSCFAQQLHALFQRFPSSAPPPPPHPPPFHLSGNFQAFQTLSVIYIHKRIIVRWYHKRWLEMDTIWYDEQYIANTTFDIEETYSLFKQQSSPFWSWSHLRWDPRQLRHVASTRVVSSRDVVQIALRTQWFTHRRRLEMAWNREALWNSKQSKSVDILFLVLNNGYLKM